MYKVNSLDIKSNETNHLETHLQNSYIFFNSDYDLPDWHFDYLPLRTL